MDTTRWSTVVSFFAGYCARRNTAVTSRRLIWLVSFNRGAHVADVVANGSGRTCLAAQPCVTWFVTHGRRSPSRKRDARRKWNYDQSPHRQCRPSGNRRRARGGRGSVRVGGRKGIGGARVFRCVSRAGRLDPAEFIRRG